MGSWFAVEWVYEHPQDWNAAKEQLARRFVASFLPRPERGPRFSECHRVGNLPFSRLHTPTTTPALKNTFA